MFVTVVSMKHVVRRKAPCGRTPECRLEVIPMNDFDTPTYGGCAIP
jgi:hypothetical protein